MMITRKRMLQDKRAYSLTFWAVFFGFVVVPVMALSIELGRYFYARAEVGKAADAAALAAAAEINQRIFEEEGVNCTRNIANPRYDDGFPDTAPVGSFPAGASPYGAMDMSGNVWEWVSTLIQPYPYDAADGREDLDAPGERAWRGGPWSNGYWWMRSSVRYRSVPEYKWYVLGFRCASSK